MISVQRRGQIEAVLQHQLGSFGYEKSSIEERLNSDGEPSIYVVAIFGDPSRRPPSRITTDAMVALRDALLADGDERFPYLSYRYPEESTTEAA